MNQQNIKYQELSYEVMKCCFAVHNYLGSGFLEIVYEDALQIEFDKAGIPYSRERKYEVWYKGHLLPHFFCADFVIDEKIILEVKGQSAIVDMYIA